MNLKIFLRKHRRNIKNGSIAAVEEALQDVETNDELANSVIKSSISELESYIDEVATSIENRIADMKKQRDDDDDKVTIVWQKIREFRGITKTADHNLDKDALKTQEIYFRDLAKEELNKILAALFKEFADVSELKADEIRLRQSQRSESEQAQSIVEEEAQKYDLTRFQRFKQ